MSTIVLDFETTGLLKPSANLSKQPYITEVCALKINKKFKVIDELESLIKVPIPLEPVITKLTGITDEMLEDQPTFPMVYNDFVDFFLGSKILVAHNAPFDMGVLYFNVQRMGEDKRFPWPPMWRCTAQESEKIAGKRLKLRDLHECATGVKHEKGAHRARGDVDALITCYKWMIGEGYFQ